MNMNLAGLYLNGLSAGAERVCFKNIVFQLICRDQVKCATKYLTMKQCSNLQHMDHTKMFECE